MDEGGGCTGRSRVCPGSAVGAVRTWAPEQVTEAGHNDTIPGQPEEQALREALLLFPRLEFSSSSKHRICPAVAVAVICQAGAVAVICPAVAVGATLQRSRMQ